MKCKKCGERNKFNATFCANCGNELKKINVKRLLIILVAAVVIIAGIGFIKMKFFDSKYPDIDVLNTKEARKEVFEDDEYAKAMLENSLSSKLDKMVNDNYLCIHDLYLEEAPEIEIFEEDNKRIRSLGEGYYLVEEINQENNIGTLEYYLADKKLNKIDSPMNSGKYDISLNSNNEITEISQAGVTICEISYDGDVVAYSDRLGDYIVEVNQETKDYKITEIDEYDNEITTTKSDNILTEVDEEGEISTYEVEYENNLLVSEKPTDENEDDIISINNRKYYYDKNGLFVYSKTDTESNDDGLIETINYDFENGVMYSFSNWGGGCFIQEYEISFGFDFYNFTLNNINFDQMSLISYESDIKYSNSFGNIETIYNDDEIIEYVYSKKDELSGISGRNMKEEISYDENYLYEYSLDGYYYKNDSDQLYNNGLLLKFTNIESDEIAFVIKYFDKNNLDNECQTEEITVKFDKKTGDSETFTFVDELGNEGEGYIKCENCKMYLYLESSSEKFTCTRYNLSKNHDTNFEDDIGLEHDMAFDD